MTRFALSLLAATTLAGCTSNSGVATTPTFTAARFLPAVAARRAPSPDAAKRPQAAPQTNQRPYATGGRAVDLANRAATVEPSSQTMQGATWVIDDVQPSRIYRVATAPGRVTTILLPAGERFNGAVGGNVEAFLINVTYAGPRPAVSILPRSEDGTGNLQLVTTGGFYSFDLHVNRTHRLEPGRIWWRAGRPGQRACRAAAAGGRLHPAGADCAWRHSPGLAPAEAWADSCKMVVRFNAPCRCCRLCSPGSGRAADELPLAGRGPVRAADHQPAGDRSRAAAGWRSGAAERRSGATNRWLAAVGSAARAGAAGRPRRCRPLGVGRYAAKLDPDQADQAQEAHRRPSEVTHDPAAAAEWM